MKKQTLTLIIVLMSVSLAGIILVQVFWMKNAIRVKERQFDQAVSKSMAEAVKEIQKQGDLEWISNHAQISSGSSGRSMTFTTSNSGGKTVVSVGGSGSYSYATTEDTDSDVVVVSPESNNFIDAKDLKDTAARISVIEKLDSLKTGLTNQQYIVLSKFKDSANVIVDRKIRQISNQSKSVDNALNELVYEIKSYDLPVDQLIGKEKLNKILSDNFNDNGVDLKYKFAVFNPKEDSLSSIKSENFYLSDTSNTYKTRLYPDRILDKPDLVLVSFSGKKARLFRSLGFLFAGSTLFTIIILVTFYVTLRVILNQKKLSEIKSDFINNMTHEFKTPIATISLAVDSINNPKVIEAPEKIRYYTGIIGEENKRMNTRVESVLQMSLLENNKFEFHPEATDFHDLIRDAAANFRLQLEKKNGNIRFEFNAQNPLVNVDRQHFSNVVSNLIDNAVKYSAQPEIVISTHNNGNNFIFAVRDNGIGMKQDVKDKIFDQFYRASGGNIHNVKGFGLGLSYVKAVVAAAGGVITVESSPGRGTNFVVSIHQII